MSDDMEDDVNFSKRKLDKLIKKLELDQVKLRSDNSTLQK